MGNDETQTYRIELINADRAGVERLLRLSDELMFSLYPAENCFLDGPAVLNKDNVRLLGIIRGDELVGVGAVKFLEDDVVYGEIKRIFVDNAHRGRGLSKQLMDKLETMALEEGIYRLRLETGPKQPEALGLYASLGYVERGPFGDYQLHPDSIFMEKDLVV